MIFSKNMIYSKFCHGIFLPHVVLGTLHVPEHGTKGRQNGYFLFSFGDYRIYVYQHAKSQCCERTGSMITKNRFVIQQGFIFFSSILSYQSQRYVSCSFSAKFLLKIASNTAPLAIGIRPYGMDCLNESYHKSEQNQIMQAMFLIYSLTVLSIIMEVGKPL